VRLKERHSYDEGGKELSELAHDVYIYKAFITIILLLLTPRYS